MVVGICLQLCPASGLSAIFPDDRALRVSLRQYCIEGCPRAPSASTQFIKWTRQRNVMKITAASADGDTDTLPQETLLHTWNRDTVPPRDRRMASVRRVCYKARRTVLHEHWRKRGTWKARQSHIKSLCLGPGRCGLVSVPLCYSCPKCVSSYLSLTDLFQASPGSSTPAHTPPQANTPVGIFYICLMSADPHLGLILSSSRLPPPPHPRQVRRPYPTRRNGLQHRDCVRLIGAPNRSFTTWISQRALLRGRIAVAGDEATLAAFAQSLSQGACSAIASVLGGAPIR